MAAINASSNPNPILPSKLASTSLPLPVTPSHARPSSTTIVQIPDTIASPTLWTLIGIVVFLCLLSVIATVVLQLRSKSRLRQRMIQQGQDGSSRRKYQRRRFHIGYIDDTYYNTTANEHNDPSLTNEPTRMSKYWQTFSSSDQERGADGISSIQQVPPSSSRPRFNLLPPLRKPFPQQQLDVSSMERTTSSTPITPFSYSSESSTNAFETHQPASLLRGILNHYYTPETMSRRDTVTVSGDAIIVTSPTTEQAHESLPGRSHTTVRSDKKVTFFKKGMTV